MAKEPKGETKTAEMEETAPARAGGLPKLYILLGLVSLVLFNTIILVLLVWFMLPSSTAINQVVEGGVQQPTGPDMSALDGGKVPITADTIATPDQVEIDLGSGMPFETSEPNPTDKDLIDKFKTSLFAKVDKKDEAAFMKIFEANKNTIKQEIRVLLKKSTMEQKNDPRLTMICNAVKMKVNAILGTPYVKSVVAPDANMTKE